MLGGVRLTVTITHEKTCFAYISTKYSTNNEQTQSVRVICKDKQLLLWVVFSGSVPEGQIACNPMYSRLIGLDDGAEVFVSPYNDFKVLDELYVDTDSPDDQEILEHNAELLQFRILDQLRLVVANQKAVIWISVSLPIVFTPKQTGLLVNHSRVVVKVDPFNSFHGLKPLPLPEEKNTNTPYNNIGIINNGMLKPYLNVPKKLVLRAVPIDSDGKKHCPHPYMVFVHEDLLKQNGEPTIVIGIMKIMPSVIQDSDADDDNETNNNHIIDLCVEMNPIDNIVYKSLCHEVYNENIKTVLIPKTLNAILNIQNGSRVLFDLIGNHIEQPEQIEIVTYAEQEQTEIDVTEKFKRYVIDNVNLGKTFLINSGIVKQNTEITPGFLQFKLKPEILKYTMLNSESFRHCTVTAKCLNESDLSPQKPKVSELDYDYKNYCRSVESVQALVKKVLSHIHFEIHREANFKGVSEVKSNVMITGANGSGKTSLCHIIQKELTVWSHILHCRSLRGRKDIPEVLGRAVLMCQERSPSVLICDDVDSLVPPNMEGGSPQDIAYYQRLAVVIKHLLQSCTGVCVLMTSLSLRALHPTLGQFSGKPLFTAHFDVPELTQSDRQELIKHLLNDKIREQFEVDDDDVIKMAADCGGHVRDVTDYVNKKIFKAIKKRQQNEDIKPRLIEPLSKDKEKSDAFDIWQPIGGMHDVKQQITEKIFWPMMYPALFPSQACGILLYGPPGTGKSLLGSCLARLSNMKLIAVKGPELLSKYIGQSEKAVRDVFDRADMNRPCILFFDEFDSLAPKRGHDSTGVTDRVVNQLLTRLDGAEGGAACAVVAATTRPDLLDPALLRPGRLHTHVYCELPDECGRLEVLQTLTKNVLVEDGVDLKVMAARTEGFSPADLKSLLVTAQLARLEKQLGLYNIRVYNISSACTVNPAPNPPIVFNNISLTKLHGDDVIYGDVSILGDFRPVTDNHGEEPMETVVVTKEDIDDALLETKPSLSKDQILFYDTIYKRFRGETLTPEQKIVSSQMDKQRVTLA